MTLPYRDFRKLEKVVSEKVQKELGDLSYIQFFSVSKKRPYVYVRWRMMKWLRENIYIHRWEWVNVENYDPEVIKDYRRQGFKPISYPMIGILLHVNHTTVVHAFRQMNKL